jgi:hypothetical protein
MTILHQDGSDVSDLFRARYLEMVRLAGLLGADDPEDIAQEAFARLMKNGPPMGDPAPHLRAIVCNLTRNRHRHLRVVRERNASQLAEAAPGATGQRPAQPAHRHGSAGQCHQPHGCYPFCHWISASGAGSGDCWPLPPSPQWHSPSATSATDRPHWPRPSATRT